MTWMLILLAAVTAGAERSNISERTCVLEKEAAQSVRRLWELPEGKSGKVELPVFGARTAVNTIAWDAKKKTITIGTLFANMQDVPPLHLPRHEFRVNATEFSERAPNIWASVVGDLENTSMMGDPPEPALADEDLAARRRFPMPAKTEAVEFSLYRIKKRQDLVPAVMGADKRGFSLVIRCGPPRGPF